MGAPLLGYLTALLGLSDDRDCILRASEHEPRGLAQDVDDALVDP